MDVMIVTGGAGFIGSNFTRMALERAERRIVVIDKLTYAGNLCSLETVRSDPRFVFIEADIADRTAMEKVFEEHQPTSVVNFAAESHVDRSIDGPRPFVETNYMGVFELLEAARKITVQWEPAQRERFRFLHVSTDEVYGSLGEEGLFHETTPYNPSSPYSATKAGADHLVMAYHHTYGMPAMVTNCSNNYGPLQFPEKLIPLTILNMLDGKDIPIYGDGGNVRDWLYVEDHCSGILSALEKGRPGEKYNIGGHGERTNLQVIDRICAAMEKAHPAGENPAMKKRGIDAYTGLKTFVTDRPGHDRRYAIDPSKITDELGWKPAYDFEKGIEATVQWYLENLNWCDQVQEGKYSRERLGLKKD